jgi:hypothetical protein
MVQIGFSTTPKILSRFIRWVTKSRVSHSFIIFDWLGKRWVLESGFSGVVIVPWEKFQRDNIIVKVIAPGFVYNMDLLPAMEELGEKYDYGGLFGTAWVLIGRWLKMKWKNPFNDSKAMFCSELVTKILQKAGHPAVQGLDPATTTPEDLLELLER